MSHKTEIGAMCLVAINEYGDECGRPPGGRVYDVAAQEEVPACEAHLSAAAQGRLNDVRAIPPAGCRHVYPDGTRCTLSVETHEGLGTQMDHHAITPGSEATS